MLGSPSYLFFLSSFEFVMGTFPSSYSCSYACFMLSLQGCVVSQLLHVTLLV
ncbi:hypothetical protein BDV93DRAFT_194351 [Ceratobasidium sp. AG-I]|nr:hypothetical protein BDV93DRAFT_194351 [Ceratobasidium sp. AG-I]